MYINKINIHIDIFFKYFRATRDLREHQESMNLHEWASESISILKLYAQLEVNSVLMNNFLGQLSRAFINFSENSMCHPTTPKKGS